MAIDVLLRALSRGSVGTVPVLAQSKQEAIARKAIADNPEMVRAARRSGNYLTLINEAVKQDPEGVVVFWMAQRIGQLVREESNL